jgi:hypothetical protein
MGDRRRAPLGIVALFALVAPCLTQAQVRYVDTACGTWLGDTWVSNGTCGPDIHRHERIVGTIRSVKGYRVVVVRSHGIVTIDDRYATVLGRKIAPGRAIVAHGYWDAGNYYATIVGTTTIVRRR